MSTADSPSLLVVRLRPNLPYLGYMLCLAIGLGYGVNMGGVLGTFIAATASLTLTLIAYPLILSTLCRVPVIVADDEGIRFPLLGPRLPWADVTSITRGTRRGARPGSPAVLQMHPADPQAAIGQVHPWLRREARKNLAWYGTPFIISDLSMDTSLDEIAAGIAQSIGSGVTRPR